jgi:hypothetical protein
MKQLVPPFTDVFAALHELQDHGQRAALAKAFPSEFRNARPELLRTLVTDVL